MWCQAYHWCLNTLLPIYHVQVHVGAPHVPIKRMEFSDYDSGNFQCFPFFSTQLHRYIRARSRSTMHVSQELSLKFDYYLIILRVRAVFHKTVRVCHVYCNFKTGFTCRITVIFGTLKDGSLLTDALSSNICFRYRNMFQNGVDALSKKLTPFCQKAQNFI